MKIMIDDSCVYDEINVFDSWYRIAGTMQLRNQTQKEAFNSIKMMIKHYFFQISDVIHSCWSNIFHAIFFFQCFASANQKKEHIAERTRLRL